MEEGGEGYTGRGDMSIDVGDLYLSLLLLISGLSRHLVRTVSVAECRH